jgi:N-acyl-D-aspartate/D-glutamate deacylase
MHDLVIKGGTIVDGRGATPFVGDIAVDEGVISAVGEVDSAGRRELDADGAVVAPGWIDAHTHYDGQVTWDDRLEGSAANGVTTVIMGNCGVGFAPVPPGGEAELIDLMEGVEDIPGTALFEGMPWGQWETFPDYLTFLDRRRFALDVGAQLAHGALRFYVMGARAIDRDPATADDLEHMASITEAAVRAGAVGVSTSRIMAHRSMSGYSVPGTFAAEDELLTIAKAMRAGGGAVLQAIPASAIGEVPGMEGEQAPLLDEVRMLGRISRETGLRSTFSTFQINDAPTLWREVLRVTSAENAKAAQLFPMVAPRAGTVLTTLEGYHLFMRRPTYLRLAHLSREKRVTQMRRPEIKAAILSEADVPDEQPGSMQNVLPPVFERALSLTFPMEEPLDYEPTLDRSLAARAAAEGRDQFEYLYDFLLQDGGTSVGVYLGANYVDGDLEACRAMLLDPFTVTGLSDAGAHVNFICDMAIPTFNLTHWVRDRTRGERLPIELVVAKNTCRAAHVFGLADRGALEVGKRADVNVIDLDDLNIARPVLRRDLPAGGSRFLQLATGYVATIVNGVVTREQDHDTGARPGRLVRPSS